MHLVLLLILVFAVPACSDDGGLEQRRLHSIERMRYVDTSSEGTREQQLILNALQQADTQSLQSPQLVNVTMRIFHDQSNRGSLLADWISSEPLATGIRIRFSDGTLSDFELDRVDMDNNLEVAKTMVLFQGGLFIEREYLKTWKHLLADQDAEIVLIADNKSISNSIHINRIEFSDE